MRVSQRVRPVVDPADGRTRTLRAAVLLSLSLSLGLTACGSDPEPPPSPTPTPTPTSGSEDEPRPDPEPTPEPTPERQPGEWPLTGVDSDAVVSRPALAVKIENTPAARPQTGLESADVVWEQIVEFEVARLLAVYHSELPEVVGPIRSVRPMDARIAGPLGGLLVFSGGQDGIVADVARTGLQTMSHDDADEGMYRIDSRPIPHNVYGSPAELLARADDAHQEAPPEQFAFAPDEGQATAVLEGQEAAW
ncbi:DUF3048 domain-containing protein, partial [Georgenia sp. 10Sc9-8]|nr:DUF3048 domain-containing protein [Georgenia halotolerans]